MTCPNCLFSLRKLKRMQEDQEPFYTITRHKKLLIVDVDERSQKIIMKRSTGKNTWPLDFQKLKSVHDLIHQGKLPLNRSAIGRLLPTWGYYAEALLKHLQTKKIGNLPKGAELNQMKYPVATKSDNPDEKASYGMLPVLVRTDGSPYTKAKAKGERTFLINQGIIDENWTVIPWGGGYAIAPITT